LNSICNQNNKDFRIVVVCNKILPLKEGSKNILKFVEFIKVDFPPVSQIGMKGIRVDRGVKYVVGLVASKKHKPDYIMFCDADDYIGNDIAEYCNTHLRENGWFINKGYVFLRNKYSNLDNFNLYCGTSNIFHFDLMMKNIDSVKVDVNNRNSIITNVDEYLLLYVIGSHKFAPEFFKKKHTSLKPFPKRAVMWILDNGQNHGGERVRDFLKYSEELGKPIDAKIRRYFNIIA